MNTLCEVWAALCSRPGAEALDRAKARAEELRGHLDDCVVCSEVVPTTEEGVRPAYEALAGDAAELTDPAAERLLELRSDVDKQVDEAVRKVLLPRLETSQLRKRGRQFDSLELFSAIDGVSLLLERETSDLHDRRATLSPRGLEVADRTIPVKLVIGEIRIMAEVEDARARELFDWLLDAAREVPELFPGAVVSTVPRNSKEVELCVSDRPAPLDLGRQWANRYARSRLSSNPAPAGWGQG